MPAILARRKQSTWTPPKAIKRSPDPRSVVARLLEHAVLVAEYADSPPHKRGNVLRRMRKKCGGKTVTHYDVMAARAQILS